MILPLLLAVVAIAFAVYVYKNPPGTSCTCTKESVCMDYSNEPMSELGVPLIHEMVNGYKSNQLKQFYGLLLSSKLLLQKSFPIHFPLMCPL